MHCMSHIETHKIDLEPSDGSCEVYKELFSGYLIKPSFRNNLIDLIVPIRHSPKVTPMTITSSIFIATITCSILKNTMGGLVSLVNFC